MSRWDPGTVGGGGGVDSVIIFPPKRDSRTVRGVAKLVGDDDEGFSMEIFFEQWEQKYVRS